MFEEIGYECEEVEEVENNIIENIEEVKEVENIEEVKEKVENMNIQGMIEETKKMLDEVRYAKLNIRKGRRK